MTLYNNYDEIFYHDKTKKRIGQKECGIYDNNGLAIGYRIQFFDADRATADSGVFIGEQKYLFDVDLKF